MQASICKQPARLSCTPEAVHPAADGDPAADLLPTDLAAHVRRRRPLHALRHQPAVPEAGQTLSSEQCCDVCWGDPGLRLALHRRPLEAGYEATRMRLDRRASQGVRTTELAVCRHRRSCRWGAHSGTGAADVLSDDAVDAARMPRRSCSATLAAGTWMLEAKHACCADAAAAGQRVTGGMHRHLACGAGSCRPEITPIAFVGVSDRSRINASRISLPERLVWQACFRVSQVCNRNQGSYDLARCTACPASR